MSSRQLQVPLHLGHLLLNKIVQEFRKRKLKLSSFRQDNILIYVDWPFVDDCNYRDFQFTRKCLGL